MNWKSIDIDDALEAVDEVANEIPEEDMMIATREMVADGTAQRIRERLRMEATKEDGPVIEP